MPKLWNNTIETHRLAVREAVLDTAAAIVADKGLTGVTMSQIAEKAGIGRATLYKYFTDLPHVLSAWHEREITQHLHELELTRDSAPDTMSALRQVLETYARIGPHRHREEALVSFLHDQQHNARAHHHLHKLLSDLIKRAADAGSVRTDIPADELTHYCLNAMSAAADLKSAIAIERLVKVTMDGLRTSHPSDKPMDLEG